MPAHLVAAVAYDGLCTFEFGCVVELFSLNRPELGVRWYDFGICAAERKLGSNASSEEKAGKGGSEKGA